MSSLSLDCLYYAFERDEEGKSDGVKGAESEVDPALSATFFFSLLVTRRLI